MTTIHHVLTIAPEQEGRRLDQALAELLPDYSRSRIKTWIVEGQVRLDGQLSQPRARVSAGQQAEIHADLPAIGPASARAVGFEVVYEDESLLVIDKPAGLVVHPGAGNPDATLMNGLLHHAPAMGELLRGGLLHRLNKDTSGLILAAKTLMAHTHLTRDLQERRISREYRALVNGVLTAGGSIDAPVGRHPTQRTRMAVVTGGREAVTHYRVLARFAAHTWLALRLETGRTHQIRVHLAHLGYSLVGDPVYGGRPRLPPQAPPELIDALRGLRRQALHAFALGFDHPLTGERLQFTAAVPPDLRTLLELLSGSAVTGQRLAKLPWPTPAN